MLYSSSLFVAAVQVAVASSIDGLNLRRMASCRFLSAVSSVLANATYSAFSYAFSVASTLALDVSRAVFLAASSAARACCWPVTQVSLDKFLTKVASS